MSTETATKTVAPCGLLCGNCVAFADGEIPAHAKELARLLGPNFAAYAQRFEAMNPVFENYPAFAELLDFLAQGSCSGCRGAGCLFTACKVGICAKEMGVDFCFECAEFPCDRHGMPEMLAGRWLANNEKMKKIGVAAYYDLIKDKPRYP